MKYKELLKSLPKSWLDVDLKTYQRLVSVAQYDVEELTPEDDEYTMQLMDNSLVTIAALMNVPVSVLKGYAVHDAIELIKLTQWVSTPPVPYKHKPDYIKDDIKITVDNYLTYQAKAANGKELENIKDIVNLFVKDKPLPRSYFYKSKGVSTPMLTDADIDNMNMVEVVTFFFFVQKLLMKSLKHIQRRMTTKLRVLMMLQKLGAKPV